MYGKIMAKGVQSYIVRHEGCLFTTACSVEVFWEDMLSIASK